MIHFKYQILNSRFQIFMLQDVSPNLQFSIYTLTEGRRMRSKFEIDFVLILFLQGGECGINLFKLVLQVIAQL